jgi:hypothetical protein
MLYSLVFEIYALQAKSLDSFSFRFASFGFHTLNEGLISKGNLLTHKASKSRLNFTISITKMEAIFERNQSLFDCIIS